MKHYSTIKACIKLDPNTFPKTNSAKDCDEMQETIYDALSPLSTLLTKANILNMHKVYKTPLLDNYENPLRIQRNLLGGLKPEVNFFLKGNFNKEDIAIIKKCAANLCDLTNHDARSYFAFEESLDAHGNPERVVHNNNIYIEISDFRGDSDSERPINSTRPKI